MKYRFDPSDHTVTCKHVLQILQFIQHFALNSLHIITKTMGFIRERAFLLEEIFCSIFIINFDLFILNSGGLG